MSARVGPPGRLVVWCLAAGAAASLVLRLPPELAVALGLLGMAGGLLGGNPVAALAVLGLAGGLAVGVLRLEALAADPLAGAIGRPLESTATVTGDWRGLPPRWAAEARLGGGEAVLLRLSAGRPPPRGSILAVEGTLRRPDPPRNGYDEAALLARRGIRAVLQADAWTPVGRRGGVAGALDAVRERSLRAYRPAGTDDPGRLLGALALGADETLSLRARDTFRQSGLAHLLAVSGSNVALLAALVLVAAWVVGAGRALAQGVAILAIAAYVGVVGASPSVVRAGVAGGLAAAAWLLSRPVDRWHLFAAGMAVLLLHNPFNALDAGFQLSFAAVAAILLAVPPLTRWFEGTPIPPLLAVPIAVSAACTLATAPIAWWHFDEIHLVGAVPANLLAAPAVPAILWLGVLAAALDPVLPMAAAGCAGLARYPCLYLYSVAELGAWIDAQVRW
jgi:competence protein ComEC